MKQIAIIDLGTNTFHLMIVELSISSRIIYRDRIAVKIGKGGINNGVITGDGIKRAMDAMKKFQSTILKYNVHQTFAYGTSALRNATNRLEILNAIKHETGIEVRLIDGDEEARYIYLGVRAAVDLGDVPNLVMDIGGGSIECIIGNRREMRWKQSFEIGAQRLLERFHHHEPILASEMEALNQHLQYQVSPLLEALKAHRPKGLVGASGTFDTLSEIFCMKNNLPWANTMPEVPLTRDGFMEIYDDLITKNRSERMKIRGMSGMRVDMIVVACCVIRFLLDRHHFESIRVSTYSLKEGVLAELEGAV